MFASLLRHSSINTISLTHIFNTIEYFDYMTVPRNWNQTLKDYGQFLTEPTMAALLHNLRFSTVHLSW